MSQVIKISSTKEEIKYLYMSLDEFNSSNWLAVNPDWTFVGVVEENEDEDE